MKSWKALLSLLKVHPGNFQSWAMLVMSVVFFGWKGLLGFYVLCILVATVSLFHFEQGRKIWLSNNGLTKADWLVRRCCDCGLHSWGNVIEEYPKTRAANEFLRTSSGPMRVGSGICIHCGETANLVSFIARSQPYVYGPIYTGPMVWHSWVKMSKGFYKMYQETQESVE